MSKVISELPNLLMFQKKAVQSFPDNQKVALYYCESLKRYYSVTYNKKGIQLSEMVDHCIIDEMDNVKEISQFFFDDGSSLNIDETCANNIINVYNDLLEEDETEFVNYLKSSDSNFLNVLKFAINRNK
jgi:hypothetical protein